MEKLIIIDGNSLVNRAFYALPLLSNSKGQYTGAVFGFANILVKLVQEQKPTHMVVAFDHARKTFRNEIYKEYKGTRKPMPDELRGQLDLLKEMLDIMHIKRIEIDGIEADDIIGTISKQTSLRTMILSGDRDVFQLINDSTNVIFTKKGITDIEILNLDTIKSIYGYEPKHVVELKSLMGDSSDNIPGVKGIGPVTALKLIDKYQTLENVINHLDEIKPMIADKIRANLDDAIMSKKLATIKCDCDFNFDLEEMKITFPFSERLFSFFQELEFSSLIKRKDIFSFEIPEKKIEIKEITKPEELLEFIQKCKLSKQFAFDFHNKWNFSCDQNILYIIKNDYTFFNFDLSDDFCLNCFKELLEDESVLKIVNDLKFHLKLFSKKNIFLKGKIFDVAIANYLINTGKKWQEVTGNLISQKNEQKILLKNYNLLNLYENVELPLAFVLAEMEQEGFKIDKNELEFQLQTFKNKLSELTQEIYASVGVEFNINSPKQLAQVLFDKLGLKSYYNKKLSTNIDVLNELSSQHEVIPLIIKYRTTAKILNTYLEPYKKLVENDEIIHTIFNQLQTATGRLSSSEPNLQNIPVRDDEGKNLRKIFVSKFKNGRLISADYNQIELRLLANFSGDKTMIDDFLSGNDIHTMTASKIFKVPLNEVTSTMRRQAKAVNFGIIYGISDFGLATTLSCSLQKAKTFIDSYFQSFPEIKAHLDKQIEQAKQNGFVTTLFGRRRIIEEFGSSSYQVRQFGERVAMNMPLQGSASDIIKVAMVEVSNKLKQNNLKSKLILQIHDELIFDCVFEEVEQVKNIIKECMENVVNLTVPLPVSISIGQTLYDCK